MIREIKDFFKFMSPIVLLIIFFIALIIGIVVISQYNACQAYDKMGIAVQYNFWAGCMAKHPVFGWMPTEQYFNSLNLNVPK